MIADVFCRRILIYLIPCRLLTSHILPTRKLLEPYPRLLELFLPLAQCIRQGDLRSFDQALQKGEDEFIKRRIYLTLERARDVTLRNLLRKVFLAGGFEEAKDGTAPVRRTRVPLIEFQAAISMGSGGETVDPDEVECLIANMIYKVSVKKFCSLWIACIFAFPDVAEESSLSWPRSLVRVPRVIGRRRPCDLCLAYPFSFESRVPVGVSAFSS